jgi:hypothetical protein
MGYHSVMIIMSDMIGFQNLFGFGDRDGKRFDTKLQHPLSVAWCSRDKTLYVADSYNHKLKAVDVQSNECTTILGSGKSGNNTGHYGTSDSAQVKNNPNSHNFNPLVLELNAQYSVQQTGI